MAQVKISELQKNLLTFLKHYFDDLIAKDCADVIMHAELTGKSTQGLLKLVGTEPIQNLVSGGPVAVNERTKLSATLEGNKNPGFHIAQTATNLCIQKAKDHGFGIVGANGIYNSTGVIGYYTEKAAKEGLIAYCCARSPGAMAPFDLSVPLFGTNPLSWAFPTMGAPVVFDMATSAVTFYDLVLANMQGKKIPENVAVNAQGELTTDPSEALDGGILPFDKGYKGSALSMMVEVFSGPLVGASYCDYKTFDKDWGFMMFAIDPGLLIDADVFKENAQDLVDIIRQNGAVVPGDNARKAQEKIEKQGLLEIEDSVAELLGL